MPRRPPRRKGGDPVRAESSAATAAPAEPNAASQLLPFMTVSASSRPPPAAAVAAKRSRYSREWTRKSESSGAPVTSRSADGSTARTRSTMARSRPGASGCPGPAECSPHTAATKTGPRDRVTSRVPSAECRVPRTT